MTKISWMFDGVYTWEIITKLSLNYCRYGTLYRWQKSVNPVVIKEDLLPKLNTWKKKKQEMIY